MKIWGELEPGVDTIQEGDLWENPITEEWEPVPPFWAGMLYTHDDTNTVSRMKIRIRRPLKKVQ